MAVTRLKWRQVNAWRLSQHCLSPRLKRRDFLKAARRTGGIQAQVMSAAEWALGARVDGLTPQDVRSALWEKHTLVKTWAMRATLHLLPASELPLYAAARSVHESRNWLKYFIYFGLTEAQYEAVVAAIPEVLGSEPMTREQLAMALAERLGAPELSERLLASSWGSLWKPSAWRGDLCFGPSQGQNVTFVNPRKWIRTWKPIEPYSALQEIARRYLRSYGPATPKDFAGWWGLQLVPAKRLLQSLEDELETVNVEGWQAIALRETVKPMQGLEPAHSVNLLPYFDAYLMGIGRGPELEPLLPKEYQNLVFRQAGWISAVVLVDGYIRGLWEYKTRGSQTTVTVQMFSSPSAAIRKGLEAEVERLGIFLNTKIALEKGNR